MHYTENRLSSQEQYHKITSLCKISDGVSCLRNDRIGKKHLTSVVGAAPTLASTRRGTA